MFRSWVLTQRMLLATLLLTGWSVVWGLQVADRYRMGSWHYFELGVGELFSPRALDFYDLFPQLQFGPLATLVAAPFTLLGESPGRAAAAAALSLAGLAAVAVITAEVRDGRLSPRPRLYLVAGLVLVPAWADLAVRVGHLDDVLALVLSVVAVQYLRADRWLPTALLLGLAVDAKPWALGFAVLLLGLSRRHWLRAAAVYAATLTVAWLPFFLGSAQPAAARFALTIRPDSVLTLVAAAGDQAPAWVRPAQLALALAVGAALVKLGRPCAVLLAVLAARILLDPATHSYYTAGAALAALLADRSLGHRGPWLTVATVVGLWLPFHDPEAVVLGAGTPWPRALWAVLVLAVLLGTAWRHRAMSVEPLDLDPAGVVEGAPVTVPVPRAARTFTPRS